MRGSDLDRSSIYQGREPREIPRYSLADAAHYLRLSPSTLSSWVRGRHYPVSAGKARFEPIIHRPAADDSRLAFSNLVEAWVLRGLRESYGLSMSKVRDAIAYAERQFGVERLLLSDQLRAKPGSLFLDRYVELIELSSGGQTAMREVLDAYLVRVWYADGLASRLYPLARRNGHLGPKVVAIDPRFSFGRPIVEPRGIKTSTIVERFDVGESVVEIAEDYDLELGQVEEAIRYERWSERAA